MDIRTPWGWGPSNSLAHCERPTLEVSMTLKIRKQDVDDQRDLVSTGDQDLTLIKQMFATRMGRATTLDDEKLLIACACHTDDDDVLLCAIIKQVETGDYEVIEKTEIAAE